MTGIKNKIRHRINEHLKTHSDPSTTTVGQAHCLIAIHELRWVLMQMRELVNTGTKPELLTKETP